MTSKVICHVITCTRAVVMSASGETLLDCATFLFHGRPSASIENEGHRNYTVGQNRIYYCISKTLYA